MGSPYKHTFEPIYEFGAYSSAHMSLGVHAGAHTSAHRARFSEDGRDLKTLFSSSVGPEWSLCTGQLAVPGHNRPQESKNIIHTS